MIHGVIVLGVLFLSLPVMVCADDVILKNGLRLSGTAFRVGGMTNSTTRDNNRGPVPSTAFWVIDDGVRRYFVHMKQVQANEEVADLGAIVSFKMKQERKGRTVDFSTVGSFAKIEPFNEFGRRTVTLATPKGMVPVTQALSEIRPDYGLLESSTHAWEYKIDTRTIPPEVLTSYIGKTSNRDDPAERKAAVLFYVQSQLYEQAQEELRLISERFPDLHDWCEEYKIRLEELIARRAIGEIERRQMAGQHQLAMYFARQFPMGRISSDVSQRAQDVLHDYEQALQARDQVIMLLDVLQAEVSEEQARRLTSMRAILLDELQYELMERLEPFLRVSEDNTLPADQKLALAYSGWVLGNDQAVTSLDEAIRLWDARFQILEYLRTEQNPLRDEEILKELSGIESINIQRVATMLRHLPLPNNPVVPEPGTVTQVEIPETGNVPAIQYSIMLPPEYNPAHRYPVLVVLRSERNSYESAIRLWAGDQSRPGWAQRRGYIVIAPHYCPDDAVVHNPGAIDHRTIFHSIDHVRKRYRVDSDRIFLTGHGMGGDACFDVSMSNPGVFAGVIPINGNGAIIGRAYRRNAPFDAWYIVAGERDRNLLETNAVFLNDMMRRGQNLVYCEYKSRGFESYAEEQERIFEWMQNQRRMSLKEVTTWDAGTLRIADNHFYWMQAKGLSDHHFPAIEWNAAAPRLPTIRSYKAHISPGGPTVGVRMTISHPGKATTIWLTPEIFNFDYRCEVNVNSRSVYRDYIKPSIEAMLTDVRNRGDRERLYWARLDL
ncbi:MAG TPA: hypothetical protein VNQ76_11140 [Planctomicrobium sp.]|nr:hypothetical protein [Planctomicrobium sp.]